VVDVFQQVLDGGAIQALDPQAESRRLADRVSGALMQANSLADFAPPTAFGQSHASLVD
jgi:hypothetical protein